MDFETVIGLEIHMKLKTKSKMFCGCDNDVFGAEPNTAVCPVCMGFPGTLPVLNGNAVTIGMKMGLALGGDIQIHSKFDRKNYFYPDLPKGYQISQYDEPISKGGQVDFLVNGELKNVRMNRLHLEEDAGKLLHEGTSSLVDLNRAGTPLAEMVTEPDFRSALEVSSFLKELQQMARYLDASNADMEKGEMRCDVNISIREKGSSIFGTKVELKNMNSFSAVERAIEYESKRQAEALQKGEKIIQETRGWDDAKGISESQRSKEEAHDYRYFPEPDLPPLQIDSDFIQKLRLELPELPFQKRLRYVEKFGLKDDDARVLAQDKKLADFFEEVVTLSKDALKSANVIVSVLLYHLNKDTKAIGDINVKTADIARLVELLNQGEISMNALKTVLEELYLKGGSVEEIIKSKGLKQESDPAALEQLCQEVLAENEPVVADYKAGKTKVFGSLVGQVMKKSGGKANPGVVNEILMRLLAM